MRMKIEKTIATTLYLPSPKPHKRQLRADGRFGLRTIHSCNSMLIVTELVQLESGNSLIVIYRVVVKMK